MERYTISYENYHFSSYVLNDKKILEEIKSVLPLSISLIGGFFKITNLISLETVNNAIKMNLSEKYYENNIKALKLGYENIKKI